MVNYREIIRLKSLGYSNTRAATGAGCSRNTVAEVWRLAQERDIGWPISDELTNLDIQGVLYPNRVDANPRKLPDFEYIHNELAKPGVTLSLLWAEYCERCRNEGMIPYQHTQFNDKYRAYASSKKATLRIKRKPGELMEVDWAGSTLTVYDEAIGQPITAYVFAACLPCSLYSYAEAFPDMKLEHWLEAHVHAYSYFDGVARITTPDNLKAGIIKNTRSELIVNRSYHEMAEHYGTAIIPARPYSPKDKAAVEGTVGVITTWIIAALRNRKFFSFAELNDAIREKLKEFNEKPFQRKSGSRLTAFEEEERQFMLPLPLSPYETTTWGTATIQPDYLITVGDCRYSVPYEFIGKLVDYRVTIKCVEVFYHNQRIASHVRMPGAVSPVYLPEHMPDKHRKYLEYNADSFLDWAASVGASTLVVVKTFLSAHKVEQQGYKACASLMKQVDRYGAERVESACGRALSYTPAPSLKNITTILKNGQDKVPANIPPPQSGGQYGIVRGASYFRGGERND